MTTLLAGVMVIAVKSLIGLALILAYLGFAFTIAFVFGRAAAWGNDVHPDPLVSQNRTCDQALDTTPSSLGANDEFLYAQVDRFDDPEGDL